MELTKNDTKMLQGFSVLAMLWLHLFDQDYTSLFTPIVFLQGVPLSYCIAQLSDFCVFGFAFCSGYGHMILFESQANSYYKRRLKGLLSLLCTYWLILIVFSIVSIIAGQGSVMPGSIKTFILHALLLEKSYNGAWWYLLIYVVLVLLSPILLRAVRKWHWALVLGAGLLVYCLAFKVRFHYDTGIWLVKKFGPFGMTLFEYLCGAECAKQKVFTRISRLWYRIKPVFVRVMIALAILAVLLYSRTAIVPSLFFAPFSGFILLTLFHFWKKPLFVQKAMLFFGKHSTNLWLTHLFFFSDVLHRFLYAPKYPILIFGFLLFLTVSTSIVLHLIEKPVQNRIARIP